MSRRLFLWCAVAMTLVAAIVRVNNALRFPVLGGYDAFAHFTYIWFFAETGKVPLADAGWEFFQPPLYYAVMASVWKCLEGMESLLRLRIGTAMVALLGLAPAAVTFAILRRQFPRERLVQLLATGLVLFLPVHLYSAGFLGNEGLNAALCALSLLQLLCLMRSPSIARAAVLGLLLGLAMLTKFTAVVVVAAAIASVALKGIVGRDSAGAARYLGVVVVVFVAVCGWYYARNVSVYGTPFRLSRDQLFLQRVENSQLQGHRNLLEYVLFDPGILYRPQWPRGLSLPSARPAEAGYSALRESIPTGLYANTWFDGFGGFALPPIAGSEASRRAGQLLLTLALVPTALMLLGLVAALRRLRRDGWDDTVVAMLLAMAAMAVVVVHGTRSVPTQAAVKATYLMPVAVAFAYLFALGLEAVAQRNPRVLRGAATACTLLAVVSVLVFTHGLAVPTEWFRQGGDSAPARNLYGIIDYAAGDQDAARRHFEASALAGWHLGYENLATIAVERGDLSAAAFFLLTASSLQPGQCRGNDEERRRAIATTQAEYANSMAVIFHALGRDDDALRAVKTSIRLDPTIPEGAYDLGVLELLRATQAAGKDPEAARALFEAAARAFAKSAELDPAFVEGARMHGVALALLGDCVGALPLLADGLVPSPPGARAWPVETGPGDLNAAGLHRRRRIEVFSHALTAESALERCGRN